MFSVTDGKCEFLFAKCGAPRESEILYADRLGALIPQGLSAPLFFRRFYYEKNRYHNGKRQRPSNRAKSGRYA